MLRRSFSTLNSTTFAPDTNNCWFLPVNSVIGVISVYKVKSSTEAIYIFYGLSSTERLLGDRAGMVIRANELLSDIYSISANNAFNNSQTRIQIWKTIRPYIQFKDPLMLLLVLQVFFFLVKKTDHFSQQSHLIRKKKYIHSRIL